MTRGFWYFVARILLIFYCVYYSSTTSKVSRKRHTKSPTFRSSDSCETSPVRQNVTLHGGIKAGYFHKLAQYVAMELCVQLCCQEKGCDVAFMIGKNCYGVKCFSEHLCRVVPAKNAPRALMISKVDFRGEVYLQKFMPEKLKCFQTLVEKNVTLTGGLTAGNFTAVGQAETINACAKLCCVRDNCDLALLVNDHCFMVRCEKVEQCDSTPIQYSNFTTYIARVNRTRETDDDQNTVQALSLTPGKSSKLMCKNGVIQYNQTLLGGYEAGKFNLLALSTNMSTCIRLCCGEKTCDVALMIEGKCYGVNCRNLKLCRAIPAKNSAMLSHLNPRISYITSRNEEVNSITLRKHSEICKSNVISYDVTLRGGKHAGKYKSFGEVDNMAECIHICCMEKHCDVAFMINGICFTVKCQSEEACEEVRAPGTGFKLMLSYVVREKQSTQKTVGRRRKAHHNRRQCKHKKDKGVHKVSKNIAMAIDVPHIPSPNFPSLDNEHYCTNSEIMYNVTLQGGITAGKFRDRGVLPNMQECLRICCIAKSCDLAFMLGNHCFSVSCKTQALCEVVTARSSMYNPKVAYIYARSKEADRRSKPKNSSSTVRRGHSRGKKPKTKKGRILTSNHGHKSSISKNSNKHAGSVSRSHKKSSRLTFKKVKLFLKKLPSKKVKWDITNGNKRYQNTHHFTDTILLEAFEGTSISRKSENTTHPVAFYKNNTEISSKNVGSVTPVSTPNHTVPTTLSTTKKGQFLENASSQEMENITSTMVGEDIQTSEKDIQTNSEKDIQNSEKDIQTSEKGIHPATNHVTSSVRPSGRATDFRDFLGNVTLLKTPKHQHSSVQKNVEETDAFLKQDEDKSSLSRNTSNTNKTLLNRIEALSGMSKPFPGINKENESAKNNGASLEKMVSETSDLPTKEDLGSKLLSTESTKNENLENQIIPDHEMVNESMDSSSEKNLSEKRIYYDRNQTSEKQIFVHAQRVASATNGSLLKENTFSASNDGYSMNLPTRKANTTDLMLLEAFSLQENVNSTNNSEGNIESGRQLTNVQVHSPRRATQIKKEENKSNYEDSNPLFETENETIQSTESDMSNLETGRNSEHMGERTKSYGDRSNFLSKVFAPFSITKKTTL